MVSEAVVYYLAQKKGVGIRLSTFINELEYSKFTSLYNQMVYVGNRSHDYICFSVWEGASFHLWLCGIPANDFLFLHLIDSVLFDMLKYKIPFRPLLVEFSR